MAETNFGCTIKLSTGRAIPVKWIGEQHFREESGLHPSFADWVKDIRPELWIGHALGLEDHDEHERTETRLLETPVGRGSFLFHLLV